MNNKLQNWITENKLVAIQREENEMLIVEVESFGSLLYLQPYEEKIIDEDFSFILSDEEFDFLESGVCKYILFEFGNKFYYSGLNKGKNRYNEIIYIPEFNDFKYIGDCSEKKTIPFAHLGVHSEYELLNGSGNCSLWAKKAKFLGLEAAGIVDKNTLAGALAFQTACEKSKIKSIIGETITVAVNYDENASQQETFELKFIVKNETGWRNLLSMNAEINVHNKDGYIKDSDLGKFAAGLVCIIPTNSYFNFLLQNGDLKNCRRLIKEYAGLYETLYYQIDTVEYISTTLFKKHLKTIDLYIEHFSSSVSPILINDSYYLDKEQCNLKSMLNKIGGFVDPESNNQFLKSVEETFASYEEWYETTPALKTLIEDSMRNTVEIIGEIDFKINTGVRKLPSFEEKDVESLFFTEIEKGIEKLLGHLKPSEKDVYLKQIETECAVIVPNGLIDYFMILWDIAKHCEENNVMMGPGRGSVCGSLIAYLLGITSVDPIKYGLMFERFLNATRVSGERAKSSDSLPDVDCDFPTYYRDEVKRYIKEKYGEGYSCSIATFGRMKLKTCLKDFGKIKGIPFDKMNSLTKHIDDQIEYTWGDLIQYATQSKELYKFVQDYPDIVHLTKYALLQCRSASVHPSAVIIVPKHDLDGEDIDIYHWMPVKQVDGVLVSEWEGKYIDKSGFLKEDILGLSQLDKFQSMIRMISENSRGKVKIDVNKIPFDDEEVFKYFKRGWCEDVFQFGTMGLMNYCRQVKPDNLNDLIAMTALFRPGPMESNAHSDFADIKNGKMKPKFDPGMEIITAETQSLYVYQEQIMKAMVIGGLSEVQSDIARTAIKKKDFDTLNSFKSQFVKDYGGRFGEDKAEEVWAKLLAFAGYGFNKSHAAAYSIMSYWSQWFKVNYPLEFWTTSLQYASETDIPFRISELKKTGAEIEIRPPDINYSDSNFTCDSENNRIFFSISKIKGCGDVAVSNIMQTRAEGGRFFDLEDFIARVPSKVNKTVVKALIIAGAFDLIEGIETPRGRKKILEKYLSMRNEDLPKEYDGNDSLTNEFWIFEQKRLTGFGEVDYETMIKNSIPNKRIAQLFVEGLEFSKIKEGKEVTVAGRLIAYNERSIKTGTACSLQIDSNNNVIQITLWPDCFEKIQEDMMSLKNKNIAVNGVVKIDKWRGVKTLYSTDKTKLYIV